MTESIEDTRQRYRERLGTEFGDTFYGLYKEWAWGLMRRHEFEELFSSAEEVSLLNAITGGEFTWDIQHLLWDDLLLRLCRLTDPKKSGRHHHNLTLRRLPALCERYSSALCIQVRNLVKAAVKKTEFARDGRNKRISHTDLETAVGTAKPFASTRLQDVTNALDAIHAVLNEISKVLLDSEIVNQIVFKPRARAFLAYARQLSNSVKFIDSAVDPNGTSHFTNTEIATSFLRKLELRPSHQNIRHVVRLREAAKRFD